ncbi:uncharacterized protein LOC144044826 isoform X2 [Vanacampus margaritifer]
MNRPRKDPAGSTWQRPASPQPADHHLPLRADVVPVPAPRQPQVPVPAMLPLRASSLVPLQPRASRPPRLCRCRAKSLRLFHGGLKPMIVDRRLTSCGRLLLSVPGRRGRCHSRLLLQFGVRDALLTGAAGLPSFGFRY